MESDPLDERPPQHPSATSRSRHDANHAKLQQERDATGSEDEEEDSEDEEPQLKYSRLTELLGNVYRNGDATSSSLLSGDKMIVGTHNGNVHVFATPSFDLLMSYHAHSASVMAISLCPFPIPAPAPAVEQHEVGERRRTAASVTNLASSAAPASRRPILPPTSSNQIYIATSSLDGNVCVASLMDGKDVQLRSFGRPIQSVALSPDFRSDRSYLSGGLAGKLILTAGGKAGTTSSASSTVLPAASSGWLASLGLASSNAKDTVLHAGEGAISTIKWSLTGRYVAWANERGIKMMRSNIGHDSPNSDAAWKRFGHVDRPTGAGWEEMSNVWKCRVEWVDEDRLESDDGVIEKAGGRTQKLTGPSPPERLLVGWGGTVWIIHVHPGRAGVGIDVGERIGARAEIVTIKRFEDCVVAGLSLFSSGILAILAFITEETDTEEPDPVKLQAGPHPAASMAQGPHRRHAQQPELRLVDLESPDEEAIKSTDSLSVGRYQSLTSADYHLGTVLTLPDRAANSTQRGRFDVVTEGFLVAGQTAARLFGPAIGMRGTDVAADATPTPRSSTKSTSTGPNTGNDVGRPSKALLPAAAAAPGMKIYIHSPYDCILAVRRDLRDHLDWLVEEEKYSDAWELLNENPDLVSAARGIVHLSSPPTPTKAASGSDGLDSEVASIMTPPRGHAVFSVAEKEKRRLGDAWIKQLIRAKDWSGAAAVCGKVLGTSSRWEHWVWMFTQADRFEEITPYIPTTKMHPPLPSLVYEYVLGHYISRDRPKLKELLAMWPPDLFDIRTVTDAMEVKLKSGSVRQDTVEGGETGRDWRILTEAMADLLVADGRPREALERYMLLQDADAVIMLIRKYGLLDAIADDVAGFLMLRTSADQLDQMSIPELEDATSEAILLLVDGTIQGIVRPFKVITQLEKKGLRPFLFLYLRDLWLGGGIADEFGQAESAPLGESRSVNPTTLGDTIVQLFAEYDRPLLLRFLQQSQSYTFEQACIVCEDKEYIPELVYLLSKTGQTKRALFLIIDKLGDVSQAILFTKSQNDAELWADLLDYSMDKPRFIRGLLEEVGTSIDPVSLVRRIPEGLEIEGLRSGLSKILKEYELQYSISQGVAKILRTEVLGGIETSRMRQRRGIKINVGSAGPAVREPHRDAHSKGVEEERRGHQGATGRCSACQEVLDERDEDTLVGFGCGHVFHLRCLLRSMTPAGEGAVPVTTPFFPAGVGSSLFDAPRPDPRSVGAKVTRVRLLRDTLLVHGCPVQKCSSS